MKETIEVVQGKQKDKKIVVAQEIAFAKVLAGNNKTLRDRAVKKLKKWLTVRGNGKWTFTEEEFLRIWTGLFYCMWMSDKFLVQEELAESISQLIHCFKKNSDAALLFIKCFNKRILMDWEGLDQYRIDKFNMLVRRFLRQTIAYCKEKNWDEELLNKLMAIFYNDVLHKDGNLGFVMHFISIYPEELAKVSGGKLSKEVVLIFVEPFVKLLARTKEDRVQKETEQFFNYLMRQTDTGIEFEEQFNAWREQGFPGEGPHCMKQIKSNGTNKYLENESEDFSDNDDGEEEDDDDEYPISGPLDPRAGSVHVNLPQIPVDPDGFISLFQKHIKGKQSTAKGKRILKSFCQKYQALKRGKFPKTIKKDPIIVESKKKKQTIKNARKLLEFTQSLDEGPILSKEFANLEEEVSPDFWETGMATEANGVGEESEEEDKDKEDEEEHIEEEPPTYRKKAKTKRVKVKKDKKSENLEEEIPPVLRKKAKILAMKGVTKKDKEPKNVEEEVSPAYREKSKAKKSKEPENLEEEVSPAFREKAKMKAAKKNKESENQETSPGFLEKTTPKTTKKRKNSENIETSPDSPENIKTKAVKKRKISENLEEEILPAFWEKAKAKALKSGPKKAKVFKKPFAETNGSCKSPALRRISFALEKNMAQENEEYLEEVKNSPRVPFDGSKKPVQSALKSGLSPTPINPFYRFKKLKL